MSLSEAETRAKLIDPALHNRGWTEDLICRKENAGAVEILEVHSHKRMDFTLWVQVNLESQLAEINRPPATLECVRGSRVRRKYGGVQINGEGDAHTKETRGSKG